MVIFVLDSSAVLRYTDSEAGADRLAEIFALKIAGVADVWISAVNYGEVVHIILRRHGAEAVRRALASLQALPLRVFPVTAERAYRAAEIKVKYKIHYSDCFLAELASDSPDHVVVTADFDLKPAATDFKIEFLPTKPVV